MLSCNYASGHQSLCRLFSSAELPALVSDSRLVRDRFAGHGFTTYDLQDICTGRVAAPDKVVLVTCEPACIPPRSVLNNVFQKSAIFIIPLLSFAADDAAIEYLDKTLSKIDFEAACAANMQMVERLERVRAPIVVQSGNHRLSIELSSSLEIALPKLKPEIAIGEWVSIGQFLEIGLVPNESHTAFIVNGTLLCDGAAVAHHRHNLRAARPLAFKAWDELSLVRSTGGFPLTLTTEASRVTKILTANGECILERILPLTDEVFRGFIIEVAFASIPTFSEVDWTINSQLNEAAGGFHVALGTGVHAAHVDFISSNAIVTVS